MPLVVDLLRDVAPPRSPDTDAILESGVLALRREHNGKPMVLLISKRPVEKVGYPEGRRATSEPARERSEGGIRGSRRHRRYRAYFSRDVPSREDHGEPVAQQVEVWVYLLEVTETLPDWPEREKRSIRWVSCEAAVRQLREPIRTRLCHRLAQS